MNRNGSVILHVLVTGVIVALIAALLLRMTMIRYMATTHAHLSTQMKRLDESALARLTSNWSSTQLCTSFAGYSCSGVAGTCGCTCTSAGEPTIATTPSGAACKIVITSPDLLPAP